MSITIRNFIGSGNRLVELYLSQEAKEWAIGFENSDTFKQLLEVIEELNSLLPPGEKFMPSVKTEKYSDRFRIYNGYNNLAVAPAIKRNARNKSLLSEKDIKNAHEKISNILDRESLTFDWSYWVPTEKFEVNILSPFLLSMRQKPDSLYVQERRNGL